MKIRKNDNIIVLAGKYKGKKGKVIKALPGENKVIVEGINMVKRHNRSKQQDKKGEIIDIASPIDVSNVALLDPKDGKPTRISVLIDGDKKERIARRSGQKIDK